MAEIAANTLPAQNEKGDKVSPPLPDEADLAEGDDGTLSIDHTSPPVIRTSAYSKVTQLAETSSKTSNRWGIRSHSASRTRRAFRAFWADTSYISSATENELFAAGWDRAIDSSTTSSEIFETLTASSYALGRQAKWPLHVKEREAILIFEELHLVNIQRLQLRLLDISRGCANPPVKDDDELHRLLHQYSWSFSLSR